MAGRRKPEALVPTNALVASAVAYQGEGIGKVPTPYRPVAEWQGEAWRQYDICPELRMAAGWIGNALSRCLLKPGEVDNTGQVMASSDPAIQTAINQLFYGPDGQAQMLQKLGVHLTVAGEVYLVGRKAPTNVQGSQLIWEVIGVNELRGQPGGTWYLRMEGSSDIPLDPKDTIIRIWRPHPTNRMQADSPVRGLLPTLAEMEYLTLHIFAQARSRLAGAGVQVFPDTVEFPGSEKGGNKAEGLMKVIGQAMATSIKNPGDASALVPIFVTVPAEAVDKIKEPLHYWSPFDEKAIEGRRAAMARFGTGMDLPPEIIAGMTAQSAMSGGRGSGVSHWTSWQIEESAIKLHIEPLAEVLCNGIVLGYLRPVTQNPRAAILVDSTKLKLQPDRSKEALELYAVGEINPRSLRNYSGFTEDDQPTAEDTKRWLELKLASGSATPDQVAAAAALLGVKIPEGTGQVPATPTGQSPSLRDHPAPRSTPDTSSLELLSAVSEPLVLRALERVGGRLRNQGIKPPNVPQQDVYLHAEVNGNAAALLEGAWSMLPTVTAGICNADGLQAVLQAYVDNLLHEKVPHSREALRRYLELMPS